MGALLESALAVERVDVFDRVVVEVDETPECFVAAGQAKCLVDPEGQFELLGVLEGASAAHAGFAAVPAAALAEAEIARTLEHAKNLLQPTGVRFVSGRARHALLAERAALRATLVAVGLHPHRLLTARLLGTLELDVLHEAPCSVLFARPGWGPAKPQTIVVGLDGSQESMLAKRAAQTLVERLGVELKVVIALGDGPLETVFGRENAEALLDPRDSASALAAAGSERDLVVIGHAGGHVARRLGRMAERVVYAARSSVLVVRPCAERP